MDNTQNDDDNKILLLPTYDEVIACQFSSWYPIFSNLKNCKRTNVTIKSIIIDLPDEKEFITYLNTDKLIIPNGTHTSSALLERASNNEDPEWSSDDDDDENDAQKSVEESSDEETVIFEFPELTKAIDKAIIDLGGSVIPKLNWSTPKDATWVNAGTLECRFAGDVYMLIKASDFCSYDINHSIIDINDINNNNNNNNNQNSIIMTPPKLQLILRKYCNLYPSQEFRCFVYNKKLIAISQRNHTQHYPHLVDHNCQNNIRNLIIHFFNTIMYHNAILNQYIFDIYIDKKQRIWLIDINVWGTRTDSLLYTWSELIQLCNNDSSNNEDDITIRVVETDKQVRVDPLSSYKAPIDTVQILSGGGTNSTEFLKFMKMCKKPTDDVSSSSDYDDDDNEDI